MIYFADDQGMTLYALARRVADGLYWDGSAYVAKSAIAWQSLATAMTEAPIGNESTYTATISGLTSEDGHIFEVYEQLTASPDASDGPPYLQVDAAVATANSKLGTPTISVSSDIQSIKQDTGETIPGAIEEIAEGSGLTLTAAEIAAANWAWAGRWLSPSPVVTVPSVQAGNIEIIQGDTYGPSAKAIAVNASDGGNFPADLSAYTWAGAFVKDTKNLQAGSASVTATVTVTTATGSSRGLSVALSATQTGGMALGRYRYDVQGTHNGNASVWTVRRGVCDVLEDCSA